MLTIKNFITAKEVKALRDVLEKAPFQSGTTSGKKTLKNNLQADRNHPQVKHVTDVMISKMMSRQELTSYVMPKNVTLMYNRYDPGMTYKDHMDAALMGPSMDEAIRSDLSFTVFLSDPMEYEGGEFVIQTPYGEQRIKHQAGTLMSYPTNVIHRVDEVTSGSRWAAVGWFQSFIKDPQHRLMNYEMDKFRHKLVAETKKDSSLPEEFAYMHQNLLRTWVDV
ncbi:Fe2+-dependent dioxygenase [Rhodovibrionaceae bacterium A322]